jgi:DNA-binding response OmpR family regulator
VEKTVPVAPKNTNEPAQVAEPVVAKASSMVVVLAKNASSVRATVTFLERRGFSAKIAASLNEAVDLFSRKEANKLLLSVNFPHPKVEMLPVLMNQSFQIETIVFAEESDRKSQNRLSNAKTKHVLFGPVSGPVVMMKVRQIDRELEGGDDEAASGSSRVAAGEKVEGDIKVGGRKAKDDDTLVLNGKSEAAKKAALDTLMKTLDDPDAAVEMSTDLQRSGETYIQKGQRSKMKSETQEGLADSSEGVLSAQAQAMRQGIDIGLQEAPAKRGRLIMPTSFRKPRSATGAVDDPLAALAEALLDQAPLSDELKTKSSGAAGKESRKQERASKESSRNSKDRLNTGKNGAPESSDEKESGENSSGLADLLNASSMTKTAGAKSFADMTEAEKQALGLEERIRICLRESLAMVAGAPTDHIQQLSLHNHAALVSLRTPELKCAFIVSLSFSKQTSTELFHRLEIAFFSLLRDYGIEFENEQTHSILLDDKSIVKRAFEASDYVVVTRSVEIEIGVAEVLINNPIVAVQPYEENMLSVNIQDVPVDEPVPFNLFLHLKRNQKFIRYLKKGSSISGIQVERLEVHQVQTLVEQQEVEAYRRHFAAHSIQAPQKKRAS